MLIKNKICSKCRVNKSADNFVKHKSTKDKLSTWCKLCSKIYREENKVTIELSQKKYYQNNSELVKERSRLRQIKYKNELKFYFREYSKIRRQNDPMYKLIRNLRRRLNKALHNKTNKIGSVVRDLGCSIADFKQYIESKFQPGMTWKNHNYYGWHLDHIKPLSSFDLSNRQQFQEANHYTNLQPLWAKENLQKSDKIT